MERKTLLDIEEIIELDNHQGIEKQVGECLIRTVILTFSQSIFKVITLKYNK